MDILREITGRDVRDSRPATMLERPSRHENGSFSISSLRPIGCRRKRSEKISGRRIGRIAPTREAPTIAVFRTPVTIGTRETGEGTGRGAVPPGDGAARRRNSTRSGTTGEKKDTKAEDEVAVEVAAAVGPSTSETA